MSFGLGRGRSRSSVGIVLNRVRGLRPNRVQRNRSVTGITATCTIGGSCGRTACGPPLEGISGTCRLGRRQGKRYTMRFRLYRRCSRPSIGIVGNGVSLGRIGFPNRVERSGRITRVGSTGLIGGRGGGTGSSPPLKGITVSGRFRCGQCGTDPVILLLTTRRTAATVGIIRNGVFVPVVEKLYPILPVATRSQRTVAAFAVTGYTGRSDTGRALDQIVTVTSRAGGRILCRPCQLVKAQISRHGRIVIGTQGVTRNGLFTDTKRSVVIQRLLIGRRVELIVVPMKIIQRWILLHVMPNLKGYRIPLTNRNRNVQLALAEGCTEIIVDIQIRPGTGSATGCRSHFTGFQYTLVARKAHDIIAAQIHTQGRIYTVLGVDDHFPHGASARVLEGHVDGAVALARRIRIVGRRPPCGMEMTCVIVVCKRRDRANGHHQRHKRADQDELCPFTSHGLPPYSSFQNGIARAHSRPS